MMTGETPMSREECLLTLAIEQFPELTDPEKQLVRAASAGRIADYRELTETENSGTDIDAWGISRTIRALARFW
jgi:hypothetical protein